MAGPGAGLHLPIVADAAGAGAGAAAGAGDPAAGAAVPWTRHVLTDLGDSQSLDLDGGLSTFSAHLRRLQRILRASAEGATRDSDGEGGAARWRGGAGGECVVGHCRLTVSELVLKAPMVSALEATI